MGTGMAVKIFEIQFLYTKFLVWIILWHDPMYNLTGKVKGQLKKI